VIIENNEAKAQKFASENWLMLIGDATQEQTLRDAQIEHARAASSPPLPPTPPIFISC
jgi:Trk K+ transport system NAD-binding subunit